MEKWKAKEYDCKNCEINFIIEFETTNDDPSTCPFCGHDLEDEHKIENEEDED